MYKEVKHHKLHKISTGFRIGLYTKWKWLVIITIKYASREQHKLASIEI